MAQESGEVGRSREESQGELTDEQLAAAQEAGKTALSKMDEGEVDDLLAEIDDVLETNAEDFVKAFIQKGGE